MSQEAFDIEMMKKSFEEMDNINELFSTFHELMSTTIGSDGEMLLVGEAGTLRYLINQTGWNEVGELHDPLIRETLEKGRFRLIPDASEYPGNFERFTDTEKENLDSLLLYPIEQEGEPALLLAWKKKISEKEQVMVPLIVGSERIGITTQVKHRRVQNGFDDEVSQKLESLAPLLDELSVRFLETIRDEKRKLAEQFENIDSESTIREVAKNMMGQLMGISASLDSLKSLLTSIKRETRTQVRTFENVLLADRILHSVEHNILETILSASENDIARNLLGREITVDTRIFFEHLIYPYLIEACLQERDAVCHIDNTLKKEIFLDAKSAYSFLNLLIRTLFQGEIIGNQIQFSIKPSRQNPGFIFEMSYKDNEESVDENTLRDRIFSKESPGSIALLYDQFVRAGGMLQIKTDSERSTVRFMIYFPATDASTAPLSEIEIPEQTKVGFLIDRAEDYFYANAMAKYLFSLGLSREKFVAAEDLSILKRDPALTHLVIFESKFDPHLFKEELKDSEWIVMIVRNGCEQHDTPVTFDYSHVDLEMHRYDTYLRKIEELLIMGSLK